MRCGKITPAAPIPTYLMLGNYARERIHIQSTTLIDDSAHVLWADRLDSALDLIDVLSEVTIEVAIVVAEVCPLQFTHAQLRSETECSFTNVLFRHEAFERFTSDDEHHFVRSSDPSWVTALSESVRYGSADDWVDENKVARTIEASSAERLLVDTKSETTIAHELITADGLFTELEATSGEIQEVFLNVLVVAEVLDLIGGSKNLEEFAVFGGERFGKHLFAEESSNAIESLEVHWAVWEFSSELGVDLLHITSQVVAEAVGCIDNVFDTALN